MATNTRSSNLPDFEHYDPSHHAGNELKSFKTWLRRFENRYEIVTDIAATANAQAKDADKKRWLLNFVSDGVLDNFGLFTIQLHYSKKQHMTTSSKSIATNLTLSRGGGGDTLTPHLTLLCFKNQKKIMELCKYMTFPQILYGNRKTKNYENSEMMYTSLIIHYMLTL